MTAATRTRTTAMISPLLPLMIDIADMCPSGAEVVSGVWVVSRAGSGFGTSGAEVVVTAMAGETSAVGTGVSAVAGETSAVGTVVSTVTGETSGVGAGTSTVAGVGVGAGAGVSLVAGAPAVGAAEAGASVGFTVISSMIIFYGK